MRTQEQINEQLQTAYNQLERTLKERDRLAFIPKCKDCRYYKSRDNDRMGPYVCTNPLINMGRDNRNSPRVVGGGYNMYGDTSLCGPEKVLWRRRRAWPVRLAEKVLKVIFW